MGKLTRIERKKRNRRILFNFLILIVVISLMIVFTLKSSVFNIKEFEIKGNKKISKEEIIKASMISKGENIFRIKKNQSKDKIKEIPYIKEISLERKLPNKVEMNIVERETILFIQKLSAFLAIDKEGHILELNDENKEEFPVFTGINIDNVDLGDNVFSIGLSNDIIDFIQEALDLKILNSFDKVDLKVKDNIHIQLKDGIYVAFGPLNNVKYKLRLLHEIIRDTKEKNIKFTKIIMNKGANPILVTED